MCLPVNLTTSRRSHAAVCGELFGGQGRSQVGADAFDDGFCGGFADIHLNDVAIAAEQNVRGETGHTVLALEAAVGVQTLGPGHLVGGDERAPRKGVVVFTDANDYEVGRAVDGLQALNARQGATAGAAPGSPEVEKNDSAPKFVERGV